MAEYIEREATVKLLRSLGSRDYRREKGTIQEAIKMVSFPEYTPPADVAPIRHGHWIRVSPIGIFECSECGNQITVADSKFAKEICKWCLHCGAKMDEVSE